MKIEDFDLNKMWTFSITIYPDDKTKYKFEKDENAHDISGLLFAESEREVLKKLYKEIGVEKGNTICHPNIRHFISEQIPFINENKMLCMGFSTR